MLTNSVSTLKSPLQFPLNIEVILTSCSKNVVMPQFMKNTAMLKVLHISPSELIPTYRGIRDRIGFKPDLLR